MSDKKIKRIRRAQKGRARIRESGASRLVVFRTPKHMYAQIIEAAGDSVLVSASTVEKAVKSENSVTGNVDAAAKIGTLIAERAKEKGVEAVAFDRSGFKYHGRVKALADAAREAGLKF